MSTIPMQSESAVETSGVVTFDMKLEIGRAHV